MKDIINDFTLKNRNDAGTTPTLNYWGANSEYGILKDVLLGPDPSWMDNVETSRISRVDGHELRSPDGQAREACLAELESKGCFKPFKGYSNHI